MTLEECYQQNEGQALLVPGGGAGNNGQCAQWADTVLHDVYGFPYVYTPGAIDWYLNAEQLGLAQYFDRVSDGSIKKGDFVIYGTGVGSIYGHIDVAAADGSFSAYAGYDSNWGGKAFRNSQGYPILHIVNHSDSYNQYILGVLRLKSPGKGGGGDDDMIPDEDNYFYRYAKTFQMIRGRSPSREEFQISAVGKTWLTALEILEDSDEANDTQHAQDVGQLAIRDKWDQQIYGLQDQLKATNDKLNQIAGQADLSAKLQKQVTDLTAKNQSLINQQTKDTETGNSFIRFLGRLFSKSK